ncbi:FKBP-type peptidyl-prolyl cis-trans isomerase [Halopelagius longus]|uniref:Peptidyl-prolyl cis-trans isomerase n=1 Tax=Halopelagius longus TaxID=1236180 RepID=A0A1H1FY50_9EURY|nr:FKBP-type peptidyl-prolyl cis-trans isomerase [Halopelagius longus]RDI69955.1 peptidylprolyl isomerase [Halopelagius longus]SDR05907.1 peptidyl-prolyl cis-trans isomerase B (cyclophilin B) [Halopelagius longus]
MAIEPGDRVTVEYVGRFEDGSVFDTSDYEVAEDSGLLGARGEDRTDYSPLSFTVGEGEVIEGLETGVVGMEAGEEATLTVPPEEAYGEFDADRVREYDAESFEGMVGRSPEVGLHVHAQNGLHGDVTAVRDDTVEVDFNHELAGKTLVFEVEVVDVE